MSATALPATGVPAPGWAPCSDRSLERADPMAGTGGYGARWLLVEIDGGWGEHAFFQSRLDPAIGHALVRRVEDAGIRPVAIRRFGRRADERRAQQRWRWALVEARPGLESVRWGVAEDPAELLALPLDGTAGTPSERPIVLVCTHARHDRCCAVRGRPVAQALSAAYPAETWESSHLGGDRFAATMIVLPEGLYYGRVPASDAAVIVERYAHGEIVEDFYRGRSSLTNVVQAAQAFARADSGDLRIGAFAPLHQERSADGEWRVELAEEIEAGGSGVGGSEAGGSGVVTVRMRERLSEPLLSTCSATRPAAVRQFELVSLSR